MPPQLSESAKNLLGQLLEVDIAGTTTQLELVKILGLGAYGVVYLAKNTAADIYYAIKCLSKKDIDERHQRFQEREIALHSLVSDHANVVSLHTVVESDEFIFMVMDCYSEGDLFCMITEKQRYLANDSLIRSVFLQLISALEYAHQRNVYHRDLKPENILCSNGGSHIALADFGLATNDQTSRDFGCGSTFYMSPECQGGLSSQRTSYPTASNDIWSLGVILVNLTCGRNPWRQACTKDETFSAFLTSKDFLRAILPLSVQANEILKRIFCVNHKNRISLAELRQEIRNVNTFVMTPLELLKATPATKEAAKPFFEIYKIDPNVVPGAARGGHPQLVQQLTPPHTPTKVHGAGQIAALPDVQKHRQPEPRMVLPPTPTTPHFNHDVTRIFVSSRSSDSVDHYWRPAQEAYTQPSQFSLLPPPKGNQPTVLITNPSNGTTGNPFQYNAAMDFQQQKQFSMDVYNQPSFPHPPAHVATSHSTVASDGTAFYY